MVQVWERTIRGKVETAYERVLETEGGKVEKCTLETIMYMKLEVFFICSCRKVE